MKKTALLLTRHFVACEWVSQDIIKVLFAPAFIEHQITKEHAKAYAHIEYFKDFRSGLVELKAEQLHQQYHFTHVVALEEENLIRAARIRESFGLTNGQSVDSALTYRDKVKMKQLLSSAGIRVPTFASVESASDIVSFVKSHGLPAVVKPRKGYSSVNTTVIKTQEDLEKFLNSGFNTTSGFDGALDLEIESFVEGEMYHIDGMVFDGQVKFVWPSKYVGMCVSFLSGKFLASYTLHKSNPLVKRLQEFTVKSIGILGGPKCFPFHAEAWHTPVDDLVFCEIASRTGGAGVRHQVRQLYSFIQDKTWTQWQTEDTVTNPDVHIPWDERSLDFPDCVAWLFIYPQVGKLGQIPSNCDLKSVLYYSAFLDVGTVIKTRENCVDAACSIVVTGANEEFTVKNIHEVYAWFEKNTHYDPL